MSSGNYNKELLECLYTEGETVDDIECIIVEQQKPFGVDEPNNLIFDRKVLSQTLLEKEIIRLDKPFYVWTKNFVYFLVYYDMTSKCHICCVPRNPNKEIEPESFAGGY